MSNSVLCLVLMIRCDICGGDFKTAQGLAGHRRLRHGTSGLTGDLEVALSSKQLQRKVLHHLSEKLADKLADTILRAHGDEILSVYLDECSREGLDLLSLWRRENLNAIIVAAGENQRLLPLIADKPTCLLEIENETILNRILKNLRACGINNVTLVRGYQGNKIKDPAVRFYENRDYKNNGVLNSLFLAEDEMDKGFVFSYADIIYKKNVLEKLLEERSDISLVVNTNWERSGIDRYKHSNSQAELVKVNGDRVTQIGRNTIPAKEVYGEFIGLAKFTKRGAEVLKANYKLAKHQYRDKPFHQASSFDKAYMTDMMQELIDRGCPVNHIDINGGWVEIDTIGMFNRVRGELDSILTVN